MVLLQSNLPLMVSDKRYVEVWIEYKHFSQISPKILSNDRKGMEESIGAQGQREGE